MCAWIAPPFVIDNVAAPSRPFGKACLPEDRNGRPDKSPLLARARWIDACNVGPRATPARRAGIVGVEGQLATICAGQSLRAARLDMDAPGAAPTHLWPRLPQRQMGISR